MNCSMPCDMHPIRPLVECNSNRNRRQLCSFALAISLPFVSARSCAQRAETFAQLLNTSPFKLAPGKVQHLLLTRPHETHCVRLRGQLGMS